MNKEQLIKLIQDEGDFKSESLCEQICKFSKSIEISKISQII